MRLIDADKIVEVAEHAYGEWNKAMGAAEGAADQPLLQNAGTPGGDPMTKQQLVDEYAREHLCATCEWKNDNICTLPRCMKMEERSKNERKTAQPRRIWNFKRKIP